MKETISNKGNKGLQKKENNFTMIRNNKIRKDFRERTNRFIRNNNTIKTIINIRTN